MSRTINLTDRHFNRLTVISEDRTENKRTYWLCHCECGWEVSEQAQNRRSSTYLTFQGKTLCVTEWARVTGIRQPTLFNRLKAGWSVERALTTKPPEMKKHDRRKKEDHSLS